jgi:hypothetical protein
MNQPVLNPHRFESTTNFQYQITKVNDSYLDLLLTAARFRAVDPMAAYFLGVPDEVLSNFSKMRKSDFVNAAQVGAPIALPRFSDAATMRCIRNSNFQSSVVHHAICASLPLAPAPPRGLGRKSASASSWKFEACPALQESTMKANDAYIDFVLMAAQNSMNDPLSAFLLGVSHETLAEYSQISRADLVSASKLGAPLFVPRFTNMTTLQALLTSGFKSSIVQQELTKTFSLAMVPQRKIA